MRNSLTLASAIATVALLAGCGSSGNSYSTATKTTTAASAPAASTGTTSAATPASTGTTNAVLIATKHNKLGTVLAAGPKKLTVYMFEADKGPASTCTGACAQAWPPVTTSGAPAVAGSVNGAKIKTISRSDGTTQVTYNGHPLYFFVRDKDDEDAYGEGVKAFGADWYVLAPSGSKIDSDEGDGGNS